MARIRQADVEEVKARINIAEIIGERVALRSAGVGSLKGLCPFHDEKSPSFHVRPQVGYYHCFGCGESGDVYSFVRAMDHLSFSEAVERLAAKLGYPLQYEEGGAVSDNTGKTRLFQAHTAAEEFYQNQLHTPAAALGRQFLGERGFDAEAAARFGVGYAPPGWQGLSDYLSGRGFTAEELITAGLVSQGKRGIYDRFRGRLVWPIRDITGQTIGFGARKLEESDTGPKYLNTPETPIYRKSQVLYGLDLAKRDIVRSDPRRVVIVEGYTDVMACHLAGVTTAVATCGTAFGSEHISVMRRVMGDESAAGEVVFTFDPDEAGNRAALKAFSEEKRFRAQTFVAVSREGLDPCDLRLQHGDQAVRSMITQRQPLFEFVIDQRLAQYDLTTVEGQVGALRAAAPVVADIRDQLLRPGYERVLARRLGMDPAVVHRQVQEAVKGSGAPARGSTGSAGNAGPRSVGARSGSAIDPVSAPAQEPTEHMAPTLHLANLPANALVALERDAMMGVLQYGHRLDQEVLVGALAAPLRYPPLEALREAIVETPDRLQPGWALDATQRVREPFRVLASEILMAPFPARDDEGAVALALGLVQRLLLREIEREKMGLLADIQRISPESEDGIALRIRLRDLDAQRQGLLET